MKKILLGVAGAALVVVVALVGAVSMQPTEVHIERAKVIAATPADVYPLLNDLKAFVTWSPWSGIDPSQVTEFSDPSTGVGAWYTWKGNSQVGSGKMAITAAEQDAKVVEDLQFIEPFASHAVVTFDLKAVEGGTQVTWVFDSENDFMGKAFSMVVDMDAMLGADFAKGLDQLSVQAEAASKARLEAEAKAAAELAAAEAAAAAAGAVDPAAVPAQP